MVKRNLPDGADPGEFAEPVRMKVGREGIGRIRNIGEAIAWIDFPGRDSRPFGHALIALRNAAKSGAQNDVAAARRAFAEVLSSQHILVS